MTPEIPKAILDKHPELVQVAVALAAHRAGKDVNTPCGICGEGLIVEEFDEVGVLVVTCPCGCTHHRTRWIPAENSPDLAYQEHIKPGALTEEC